MSEDARLRLLVAAVAYVRKGAPPDELATTLRRAVQARGRLAAR